MGWTAVAWSPSTGPHGGESKHARQFYDSLRQRQVIGGGDRDGSDAGQPNIYTFVAGQSTYTKILAGTEAGKMPAYPDNCTFVYASQVDRYIIARSFWFGLSYAKTQQPARPDADWLTNNGIYDPNTNTYSSTVIPTPASPYGWGGDSNSNFGMYDPVQNALVRIYYDGAWGCTLQTIPLGDLSSFPTATHVSVGSGHPSGSFIRNYIRNIDAHARQQAIDVQGRAVYCVAQSSTTMLTPGDTGWGLIKIDLNNPTLGERIPLPSTFIEPVIPSGGGVDTLLAFDSIRRRIIHPMIGGYGGEVKGTLYYDLASGTWEFITSNGPPYPQGNCFAFDPPTGAGILTGGKTTTSVLRPGEPMPPPTHYFMVTPGSEPPTPVLITVRSTAITTPTNVDATQIADHYQFTVHDVGNPTPLQTVNTANPTIRFGDFTGLTLGQAYDFKGLLKKQGGVGELAPAERTVTITGEDPNPPDPPAGDITPPTITITFPAVDEVVQGTITPVFTVSDASGILRTEVRVNGVLLPGSSFDTESVPNGDTTLTIDAWDNSTNQNRATQSRNFVVDNPAPPDPPDPPVDTLPPQAIFTYPMPENPDRVIFVLWAPTPVGFETIFQRRGSRWASATAAEIAEVEAGRTAEFCGSMARLSSDDDMVAALKIEWNTWVTKVASVATWVDLANAYVQGIGTADEAVVKR